MFDEIYVSTDSEEIKFPIYFKGPDLGENDGLRAPDNNERDYINDLGDGCFECEGDDFEDIDGDGDTTEYLGMTSFAYFGAGSSIGESNSDNIPSNPLTP